MADSSMLREAANRLLVEARRLIDQLDAEDAATSAAVPASLVNMPPETRAARPNEVADAAAKTGAHSDAATASGDAESKTAAADSVKAASDASKSK
jgi:hypothetical protein